MQVTFHQGPDPLCLPRRPQLPGHRLQVQGGGGHQRDDGGLLLPAGEPPAPDPVQLPPCNATEICKDVTVKPGQYIVNPKCLCGGGLACPSVTKKGVTKTL